MRRNERSLLGNIIISLAKIYYSCDIQWVQDKKQYKCYLRLTLSKFTSKHSTHNLILIKFLGKNK